MPTSLTLSGKSMPKRFRWSYADSWSLLVPPTWIWLYIHGHSHPVLAPILKWGILGHTSSNGRRTRESFAQYFTQHSIMGSRSCLILLKKTLFLPTQLDPSLLCWSCWKIRFKVINVFKINCSWHRNAVYYCSRLLPHKFRTEQSSFPLFWQLYSAENNYLCRNKILAWLFHREQEIE